jgi:predicted nucleotide-binding protein (sugar kinase/HSP70/actin superfamily)
MKLTLDEHSGEAGLVTRIEAFVDMLNWREQADG